MTAPRHVIERLKRYDRELVLKWIGDRWGVYRRGIYLGGVPAEKLGDGTLLIARLNLGDFYKMDKPAAKISDEIRDEQLEAEARRAATRKANLIDEAKEDYDYIKRRQGGRISNIGAPWTSER